MKVLLLSCFTGEGHNSAARAIQEELDARGIENKLMDPVLFHGRRAQRFVSSFYNNMIRTMPGTFGALYKVGAAYDATGITSPVYLANAAYAKNLYQYIEENQYDRVVATHLYGMEAMTAIRRRLHVEVPSYGVLTDYTRIPFFTEVQLTGYFIPHEDLREAMTSRGLPSDRVFATGIPTAARFARTMEKEQARQLLQMPSDKKILTVMSGGIGGGNVTGLCDALLAKTTEDYRIYVLVGRNEERKQKLQERYGADGRIQPVSFTTEVNVYMKAADVLLSKPGGLSSTEAAVANVPLIHINGIPGCETENIRFFEEHGLSHAAQSVEEAADMAVQLADDAEAGEAMRARQRAAINPWAARDIVNQVVRE